MCPPPAHPPPAQEDELFDSSSETETEEEPGFGDATSPDRRLPPLDDPALDYYSDDEPRLPMAQRPRAGGSMRHKQAPFQPALGHRGKAEEYWEEPDSTSFLVRGPSYLADRIKVRSAQAIYACVAVDAFTSPQRLDHVMRRLRLPEADPAKGPLLRPGAPGGHCLPRFFVVNIQMPTYEPRMFGHPGNGQGLSVVLVHELVDNGGRIRPQARALVERFFRNEVESTGEPSRERLKYIPRIVNLEAVAAKAPFSRAEKSLMASYDGKPVLSRPQHRFYRGPGYLEVDLDTHGYSFVARKGIFSYRQFLGLMIFDAAFVLQGACEAELPEQVLACARCGFLDYMLQRGPPKPLPPPAAARAGGRRGAEAKR